MLSRSWRPARTLARRPHEAAAAWDVSPARLPRARDDRVHVVERHELTGGARLGTEGDVTCPVSSDQLLLEQLG
jgi:hypothetical protein